jgi:enoyl-CoA hydratase/carnithine racemase
MGTAVMNADSPVLVERRGRLGILILNRPRAINALTLEMVELIAAALDAWEHDDSVATVLVKGAGERGLCAGGDIVALYAAAVAGDTTLPAAFWRAEYRLNGRIARYPKPYVAFMDGIVLGGGVGVSAHGSHRIVTERSRIGMPETGIGFAPDVGGTFLLGHAPGELGTHVALTGDPVNGADALALGLADAWLPADRLPRLEEALAEVGPDEAIAAVAAGVAPLAGAHGVPLSGAHDVPLSSAHDSGTEARNRPLSAAEGTLSLNYAEGAVNAEDAEGAANATGAGGAEGAVSAVSAVSSVGTEGAVSEAPESGRLAANRAWIDAAYAGDDIVAILARLEAGGEAERAAAATLRRRSPLSLAVALRSLRLAREDADLETALNREYGVSMRMLQAPDFAEGVRAQLVDKDRDPHWTPSSLDAVTEHDVATVFVPVDPGLGLVPPGGPPRSSFAPLRPGPARR